MTTVDSPEKVICLHDHREAPAVRDSTAALEAVPTTSK